MDQSLTDQSKSGKVLDIAVMVTGLAMALYHMVYSLYLVQDSIPHLNTHLGFSLVLVFLMKGKKDKRPLPLIALWVILTLICILYVHVLYDDLDLRAMFNTPLDLAIGIVLIIVSLEATRQVFGIVLPVLALVAMAYAFAGHLLPEPFHTMYMSWDQIIARLSIGLTGIYGNILAVSANFIFLFMVFAALTQTTGAIEFFVQVGKLVGKKFRSGPAMAAVVTSGLVGSISGQAGANVTVTGSFTIPMMKKMGYTPEQAAAIEAAASTGGPITPPVMGVAAFLMVGITGIPYHKIIGVAILPALLYFFAAGLYVHLQAAKMDISSKPEEIDMKELLLRAPLFFVPFLLIIALFIRAYSPMYVGFWAVISVIVLGSLRKETRPSMSKLADGIVNGAVMGAGIAGTCACIGIILAVIVFTGLGVKLPVAIETFFAGNKFMLLLTTGIISAILGMGMPASASYVVVAIVISPTLIKLGLSTLAAHFFAFFFANFSFITPPVALAPLFSSQLAKASYIKTSFETMKVGIGGFVLPFMIALFPLLMWEAAAPVFIVAGLISCFLTLIVFQVGFVGYFLTDLHIMERAVFILCGLGFMGYFYTQNLIIFSSSIILIILALFFHFIKGRRTKSSLRAEEEMALK
jgi:TRAP transporter 4TM/12TM fusion protein